jgi:hypothetical protein
MQFDSLTQRSLLATCTDDHRVVVYQPSNDPNSIAYVQVRFWNFRDYFSDCWYFSIALQRI